MCLLYHEGFYDGGIVIPPYAAFLIKYNITFNIKNIEIIEPAAAPIAYPKEYAILVFSPSDEIKELIPHKIEIVT